PSPVFVRGTRPGAFPSKSRKSFVGTATTNGAAGLLGWIPQRPTAQAVRAGQASRGEPRRCDLRPERPAGATSRGPEPFSRVHGGASWGQLGALNMERACAL